MSHGPQHTEQFAKVYPSIKVFIKNTMVVFLDSNDKLIVCIKPGEVVLKSYGTIGFEFITNYNLSNVAYKSINDPQGSSSSQTSNIATNAYNKANAYKTGGFALDTNVPDGGNSKLKQVNSFNFCVPSFIGVLDESGSQLGATFLDTLNALCVFLNFQPGGAGGEVNTASNVTSGSGDGLFKQKTGVDLEFKSLIGGTNVTLSAGTDDITINAAAGGEVNTASNIPAGTGAGVFKQKTGVDLEFRKINSTELDVTQNTNDITLSANSTLISGQSSVTAATGMEVLLNDSGTLKKADVSGFLGGGGKEPYFVDTLIDNFINTNQGRTNATNIAMTGTNFNDRPISFVCDVTLKEVSMTQNNASASAILGYFGLYELTSLTAIGGTYTFTKVYQESQTFSLAGALAGTNQTITLTTPQTFEAGKVYMTVVIASQNLSGASRPNIRGCFRSGLNKAVGYNLITAAGDAQIIRSLSTSQATMSGGTTMPATLDFATVTSTNSGLGGLLKLKVQNA